MTILSIAKDMSGYSRQRSEEAAKRYAAAGYKIIQDSETLLLLDLDTEQDAENYQISMEILGEPLGLKEVERWTSKTGVTGGVGHKHVLVSCPPMSERERVMLQAVLGSDRIRAAVGIKQLAAGAEGVSLLFKP